MLSYLVCFFLGGGTKSNISILKWEGDHEMWNISRFRNIVKIVDCNEMRKLLKYHCSAKLQLCPFN